MKVFVIFYIFEVLLFYHNSGESVDDKVERENYFNNTKDVISQPSFRFPPFSLRNGTTIYSRPGVLVSSWLPAYFPLPLFLHEQQIFSKNVQTTDQDTVNKIEEMRNEQDLNKIIEVTEEHIFNQPIEITNPNILSDAIETNDKQIFNETTDLQEIFNKNKKIMDYQQILNETGNITNQLFADKTTGITKLHLVYKSGKNIDLQTLTTNRPSIDKSIKITKLHLITKTSRDENPKL